MEDTPGLAHDGRHVDHSHILATEALDTCLGRHLAERMLAAAHHHQTPRPRGGPGTLGEKAGAAAPRPRRKLEGDVSRRLQALAGIGSEQ